MDKISENGIYESTEELISYVKEAGAAYAADKLQQLKMMQLLRTKVQGEFTVEDLDIFPRELRAELIDGVLYFLNAPTVVHQSIQAGMVAQIYNFIRKKKGKCRVYAADTNVLLKQDNKTNVHPDILISCREGQRGKKAIEGAPDFVAEILSPGTRQIDLTIKLYQYREAGVREYWIIDPEKKKLLIYRFEKSQDAQICELKGQAEMEIFDGALKIDLDELCEWAFEED